MKIKTIPNLKELSKYLLYFVLMYLCARAKIVPQMIGLSAGLYVALIYCRCNMYILSPLYISACLLVDCSIVGIIYAMSPILIFAIAKYGHYKAKRPMRTVACNAYALLSTSMILIGCIFSPTWGYLVLSVLANQIFTFFCLIICYAVLVRGYTAKFSTDELAGGFVLAAILGLGLYSINIFGFRPYYLVLGFSMVFSIYMFKLDIAMAVSLAIALGGAIACRSIAICGGVAMMCLVSATFYKTNMWIVATAVTLTDLLCGIFFGSYPDYDYLHIIAITIGSFCFAALPKRAKAYLKIYKRDDSLTTSQNMTNRIKSGIAQRLNLVASVFYEMAESYTHLEYTTSTPTQTLRLAQQLKQSTCARCPRLNSCESALGMPMERMLEELISTALITHRITLVDLPSFINSRCGDIPRLINNCNILIDNHLKKVQGLKALSKEQDFIAAQFVGISGLLGQLCGQIKSQVIIDKNAQEQIIQNLGYNNIVCSEATITENKKNYDVALVVRKQDVDKKAIAQVVGKILGVKLTKQPDNSPVDVARECIFLCNKPKFDIAFHTCSASKKSGEIGGDCFDIERLRGNKVMLALCDGMGNGMSAREHSQKTLSLISRFYRAGFDNSQALAIVNRLLAITSQDNFSALDMCVVDLENGLCDFIKLGGVDSIIKKSDRMIIVKSQALPIGIIDDATPQVQRIKLDSGDVVTLCSDGITDCLSIDGLEYVVSKISGLNPTVIANEIMHQAKLRGLKDDASVVVFRLFEN